jgi:alpha-L-fucosidase 2
MWPTDEIGATQTADAALLARAKQTVYALNKYTGKPWANVNGFCLSWPPAVRVSARPDAAVLVGNFATAILSTTGNNACVINHGGMLENIGATVAINDMLLQSHGGVMRFFPVWDAAALGPASFTTLRAYGAFLVSASVDAGGVVSPVALSSEVGGDVVFESPWAGATPSVVDGAGAAVPVAAVSAGVFSFTTAAGGAYTISAPAAPLA